MISTVFGLPNDTLYLKTESNVPTVRNNKKLIFVGILKTTAKKRRTRICNSVNGSKDPDLDPYEMSRIRNTSWDEYFLKFLKIKKILTFCMGADGFEIFVWPFAKN